MSIGSVNEASLQAISIEKSRGLENAALQHAKNAAKKEVEDREPAVVVEVGKKTESSSSYIDQIRKGQAAAAAAGSSVVAGDDARLRVNIHAQEVSGSGGSITLDDTAPLTINVHAVEIEGGGGNVTVGESSKATTNLHADNSGTVSSGTGETSVSSAVQLQEDDRKKSVIDALTKANKEADIKATAREERAKTEEKDPVKETKSQSLEIQTKSRDQEETDKSAESKQDDFKDPRWRMYQNMVQPAGDEEYVANGYQNPEGHVRAVA
jgi:hypothetical protein